METVVVNLAPGGKPRRVTDNGREYLVAPLTMIVPGVLNGSQGPLYYPPEEIARTHRDWEGVPLVVYHPTRNGRNVSARSPGVLEDSGVGVVKNARVRQDGALVAEGWFDVAAVRNYDKRLAAEYRPTLLPRIQRGEPVELSTGLFTDNATAPTTFRDHRGNRYSGMVARNYRPDHLAVLPDQRGACSLTDGCGVMVNSTHTRERPTMDKAQMVSFLTTNCGCYDEATLNGLSDEKLKGLYDFVTRAVEDRIAANAARTGFTYQDTQFVFNSQNNCFEANACAPKGQTMAPPAAPTGAAPPATPPGKAPAAPAVEEEAPAPAAAPQPPAKKKPPMATNMTTQEWLATVPPDVAGVFNSALTIVNEEKTRLVARLTANCTEQQKAAAVAVYNAMTVEQLRAIAPAAPVVRNGVAQPEYDLPPDLRLPAPSFLGAAGGPAVPVGNGVGGYDGWEDDAGLSPVQNVQWGK